MAARPLQHYVPAGFIGRFSSVPTGRLRERLIWVATSPEHVFPSVPEDVARERGFYISNVSGPLGDVDFAWTTVEQKLNNALHALLTVPDCSGADWLVVSEFITHLFVRGPGFVDRFTDRLRAVFGNRHDIIVRDERANSRGGMLVEAQRLAWPVMAAEWTVLVNGSTIPLVTSDVGYAGLRHVSGDVGYVIPIDPFHALALTDGPNHLTLRHGDTWRINGLRWAELDAGMVQGIVKTMAQTASRSIFGPTRDSVEWLLPGLTEPRFPLGPELLFRGDGGWLRKNEMNLFKVITILGSDSLRGAGFYRLR